MDSMDGMDEPVAVPQKAREPGPGQPEMSVRR